MPSPVRVPAALGPSSLLLPLLGLSSLLLLTAAPVASAADGWSLAPAGGSRPSFYAEGAPGAVLQDTVSVTNRGGRPVTVRLSGRGVRAVFARSPVRVPARTRADIPFTVSARGDRSGEIVARDQDGRTVTAAIRLRAGGPELSALTVERVAVHADRITYDLVNRGTTTLVPTLAVHADGLLGPVLDRAPRTLPVRIPPGRRLRLTEPWRDHPALDAVDVRLTVTAPGGAKGSAAASARFVPWGGVAGATAAVTAGGALLLVRLRRRLRLRRRRRSTAPEAPEHPCAEVELTGAVT